MSRDYTKPLRNCLNKNIKYFTHPNCYQAVGTGKF